MPHCNAPSARETDSPTTCPTPSALTLRLPRQVVLSLGILVAQAINIGTQHLHPYGWRISLAFAGMPAIVLTLGGLFLPDTPNSLVQRGLEAEGRRVLVRIRGTTEVDEELEDIKAAVRQAETVLPHPLLIENCPSSGYG